MFEYQIDMQCPIIQYFLFQFYTQARTMGIQRITKNKNDFNSQINVRNAIIAQIFNYKDDYQYFNRETQFIAISIIDKWYEKMIIEQISFIDYQFSSTSLAAASIFLASKFNDIMPIKVKRLLRIFHFSQIDQKQILNAQDELFVKIQFQIPYETAYAGLFRSLEGRPRCQKTKLIALKCLKLLRSIVTSKAMYVLDAHFGQEIYQFFSGEQKSKKVTELYKQVIATQKKQLKQLT